MKNDGSIDVSNPHRKTALVYFAPLIPALFLLHIGGFPWRSSEGIGFIVLLFGGAVLLLALPLTRSLSRYYFVQAAVLIFFVAAALFLFGRPVLQALVLASLILEIILYEPYPYTLGGSLGALVLFLLLEGYTLAARETSWVNIIEYLAVAAVPGAALSICGSLMAKYREMAVELQVQRDRLVGAGVNLTQANSAYMDFAASAQERGMEEERLRITRDIHDIVGYTLTNNMMLMEAALEVMKENALALPTLIETARENAQDGLRQVRAAMYNLREQESIAPVGIAAVVRLCRVFGRATGIDVSCHLGNVPQSLGVETDSAINHLVQECLVNSFRHGKASSCSVMMWWSLGRVTVDVEDNGRGSQGEGEGIGLRGMRERIEALGGELSAENGLSGFRVKAAIPWEGNG